MIAMKSLWYAHTFGIKSIKLIRYFSQVCTNHLVCHFGNLNSFDIRNLAAAMLKSVMSCEISLTELFGSEHIFRCMLVDKSFFVKIYLLGKPCEISILPSNESIIQIRQYFEFKWLGSAIALSYFDNFKEVSPLAGPLHFEQILRIGARLCEVLKNTRSKESSTNFAISLQNIIHTEHGVKVLDFPADGPGQLFGHCLKKKSFYNFYLLIVAKQVRNSFDAQSVVDALIPFGSLDVSDVAILSRMIQEYFLSPDKYVPPC
jgi:hypothetical protein